MAHYLELMDLLSAARRKLKVDFDKELVKNQISSFKSTPLDAYRLEKLRSNEGANTHFIFYS